MTSLRILFGAFLVGLLGLQATATAQSLPQVLLNGQNGWRYEVGEMPMQDTPLSDRPELSVDEDMDDVLDAMKSSRADMMTNTIFVFKKKGKLEVFNEVIKRDADRKFAQNNNLFRRRERVNKRGSWELSQGDGYLSTVIDGKTMRYTVKEVAIGKIRLEDASGQVYVLVAE